MITTLKPPPLTLRSLAQTAGLEHSHVYHLPRIPMATEDIGGRHCRISSDTALLSIYTATCL